MSNESVYALFLLILIIVVFFFLKNIICTSIYNRISLKLIDISIDIKKECYDKEMNPRISKFILAYTDLSILDMNNVSLLSIIIFNIITPKRIKDKNKNIVTNFFNSFSEDEKTYIQDKMSIIAVYTAIYVLLKSTLILLILFILCIPITLYIVIKKIKLDFFIKQLKSHSLFKCLEKKLARPVEEKILSEEIISSAI